MSDNQDPSRTDRLCRLLFDQSDYDYLQLWWVHAYVRKEFPFLTKADERAITISIVKQLMTMGLLIFSFRKQSEGSWAKVVWEDQDPAFAGERIAREWETLPGDPGLGENYWLM